MTTKTTIKTNKENVFAVVHGNPRQAALWAYIAGIIDGEGSIRINKAMKPYNGMKNPSYNAQINIGMVNKEIPDLLKETFNGQGNVREERVSGMRSIWRYSLTGRSKMIAVLNNLLPYLIIKKEHAKTVIDFCKNWETPRVRQYGIDPQELQRREDAFQKMRKLNAVGAAATTKRFSTREGEAIV